MANPNPSQFQATPDNKSFTSQNNQRQNSPPLCQILEATLPFNSGKRVSVSSPDLTKDGIVTKESNLDVSGVMNKTMIVGVLEQQSRQLVQERDALIAEKTKLQDEIEE